MSRVKSRRVRRSRKPGASKKNTHTKRRVRRSRKSRKSKRKGGNTRSRTCHKGGG